MHWVILGAGALGTLLAAHLTRAGHRVQLVARGARAAHLASHGLSVRGLDSFDIRCEIVPDPAALRVADVFVNTVKTYDSRAGLASLAWLDPATAFSVQNGVVKEEELRERFGTTRVLGAMADFSGELAPDGTVLFTRNVNLHLGELDRTSSERARAIASAIDAAGIRARSVDHIETIIWSKFSGWVALMVMAVLTRRYTGDYLRDPDVARVVVDITRETAQIATRRGIPLMDISPLPVVRIQQGSEEEAVEAVREAGERMYAQAPEHRLSSLQDLLRGRRLELEETVGDACRRGHALGLAMPVLTTCYRLAACIDRGLA